MNAYKSFDWRVFKGFQKVLYIYTASVYVCGKFIYKHSVCMNVEARTSKSLRTLKGYFEQMPQSFMCIPYIILCTN